MSTDTRQQENNQVQDSTVQQAAEEFAAPAGNGNALKAYNQHARKAREDKLIVEYLPMVHKIVHQVVTYLKPPLTMDDLVSAGTIGLVKAARDFDPSHDAEFKTYAYIRVKGAVIDELRSWSFTPTSVNRQLEEARQTCEEMTQKAGKAPSDDQLARKMGIPLDKLYKILETARARHFLSIHGMSEESPALGKSLAAEGVEQPGDNIEKEELVERLAEAISTLPPRQRKIIVLYYNKELTMKEIATLLKITESRVSQLHASALFKLSTKLRQWDDSRS